jgi:arylsulfatase A-like enzyme
VPKAWYDKYAHISAGAQPDERRRKYLAMVNWLDDAVGNVTALLKSKQMYDNTLIVFSSE